MRTRLCTPGVARKLAPKVIASQSRIPCLQFKAYHAQFALNGIPTLNTARFLANLHLVVRPPNIFIEPLTIQKGKEGLDPQLRDGILVGLTRKRDVGGSLSLLCWLQRGLI